MPLKTLKTYLEHCREHGVEPTWSGLLSFAQERAKKIRAPQQKAMEPLIGSSDQSFLKSYHDKIFMSIEERPK